MLRWHLSKVSPKDKIMMEKPFVIQILTEQMEVKDDCPICLLQFWIFNFKDNGRLTVSTNLED